MPRPTCQGHLSQNSHPHQPAGSLRQVPQVVAIVRQVHDLGAPPEIGRRHGPAPGAPGPGKPVQAPGADVGQPQAAAVPGHAAGREGRRRRRPRDLAELRVETIESARIAVGQPQEATVVAARRRADGRPSDTRPGPSAGPAPAGRAATPRRRRRRTTTGRDRPRPARGRARRSHPRRAARRRAGPAARAALSGRPPAVTILVAHDEHRQGVAPHPGQARDAPGRRRWPANPGAPAPARCADCLPRALPLAAGRGASLLCRATRPKPQNSSASHQRITCLPESVVSARTRDSCSAAARASSSCSDVHRQRLAHGEIDDRRRRRRLVAVPARHHDDHQRRSALSRSRAATSTPSSPGRRRSTSATAASPGAPAASAARRRDGRSRGNRVRRARRSASRGRPVRRR